MPFFILKAISFLIFKNFCIKRAFYTHYRESTVSSHFCKVLVRKKTLQNFFRKVFFISGVAFFIKISFAPEQPCSGAMPFFILKAISFLIFKNFCIKRAFYTHYQESTVSSRFCKVLIRKKDPAKFLFARSFLYQGLPFFLKSALPRNIV